MDRLNIQPMPDVDTLIDTLLKADPYPMIARSIFTGTTQYDADFEGYLKTTPNNPRDFEEPLRIFPEVSPMLDSAASYHYSIVYQTGAPVQQQFNMTCYLWRVPLTLMIIGDDPELTYDIASQVNLNIMQWPYKPPTPYGKVGEILDNPAFQRVGEGKTTTSKTIHTWQSDKLLQVSTFNINTGYVKQRPPVQPWKLKPTNKSYV